MTPRESWAPGMTGALRDLRRRLETEGWSEVGCGDRPWAYLYERPRLLWPPD